MDHLSKLIVMLILEIPSIVLSILILIYFGMYREARSELRNHGWFILLIVNFFQLIINLPMPLSYYYLNKISPATNAYCVWWTWCEYSLNSIGLFLMAWISIERHIIVFHSHTMLEKRWKKWIFHFIPLIFCLIWPPLFFFVFVVISPFCTTEWDFNTVLCGSPCYFTDVSLSQFDFNFDLVIPIIIIMLANVTLVIRVIYQKISRQQVINWRHHRKMVLQLWIISSLYIGFWLPNIITILVQITILPSFMDEQLETMEFIVYFIPLLLPMVCLTALPELIKKVKNIITRPQFNVIDVVHYNRRSKQMITVVAIR
ncbi:unnamed protein product [Adineta steineri]|uniref:G-protein coupled receptors family 1 profile domain-containing protein n=1 Tax=Adineta steineri TaxID=433720 RepID=A0A815YFN6_9BILA|nr:unnamed protein product [Adineta steineri]CAF1668624.1 unnamed protein product [Adineta steineri]